MTRLLSPHGKCLNFPIPNPQIAYAEVQRLNKAETKKFTLTELLLQVDVVVL